MIDLQQKLSPEYGDCDMCGKWTALQHYLSHHLCQRCLTEEEFYIKAREDCIGAFDREFGR